MLTAGLRVAREAALVVGLVTFFVFGTVAAQQHQVPSRAPLDALGYLLIATSVLVLPGRHRHRWPWRAKCDPPPRVVVPPVRTTSMVSSASSKNSQTRTL